MMIIVGIVLLTLASLAWFMFSSNEASQGQKAIVAAGFGRDTIDIVNQYVNQCLRGAAMDSLDTLGKQGGILYASQGGLSSDGLRQEGILVANYEGYSVAYGLVAPQGSVGGFLQSDPPYYPYEGFPLITSASGQRMEWRGFFGIDRLPPLNSSGQRADSVPSIEAQLASAIVSGVRNCLEVNDLASRNLVLSWDDLVVDVHLDVEDTTFILNSSINVKADQGTASATVGPFVLPTAVRMRRLYGVVKEVIGKEGTDARFQPDGYNSYGIVVAREKSVLGNDDMIIFRDTIGKIEGRPFEFRTMVKDRAPALLLIRNPEEFKFCPGATVTRVGGRALLNASVCNGRTTYLPLADDISSDGQAAILDPDDDIDALHIIVGGIELADGDTYVVPSSLELKYLTIRFEAKGEGGMTDWQDLTLPVVRKEGASAEIAGETQ